MSGEIRTDIAATAVPRFPILRLTWRSDGTIALDDTSVTIPDGEDPRLAALEACAAHARRRGGDQPTIRVIAIDEASGRTWPMGVTGDSDIIELEPHTEAAGAEPKKGPSRRALLAAGTIAGATLLGGGGIATALLLGSREEPAPAPSPPPPGNGDLVPVAVPDGYSSTALWTVPIQANSSVTALPDGRILTTDPSTTNLRIHDPATGAVAWTGSGNSANITTHSTEIDGRPFLIALDTSGALKLWPLDQGSKSAATSLETPSREGALYTAGPAPAVALPTQSGLLFQGADAVEFDIPVGYRLIGATIDGQAVVLGERDWALLTPGETATEKPTELLMPSKSHAIAGGYMLGTDRILVRQDGPEDSQWALYATDASNAILTTPATSRGEFPGPEELHTSPDQRTWALDGLVATPDSLNSLDDATITSVTAGGVYADSTDGPILIHPRTGGATSLPEDVTAPSVLTSELAVVVADKLEVPTAYAVQATT